MPKGEVNAVKDLWPQIGLSPGHSVSAVRSGPEIQQAAHQVRSTWSLGVFLIIKAHEFGERHDHDLVRRPPRISLSKPIATHADPNFRPHEKALRLLLDFPYGERPGAEPGRALVSLTGQGFEL